MHHVAQSARSFVEAGASSNPERFGGGDLHLIDVVRVPERREYRVRKPGAYVRCAVTGEPIPLEDLRYWNVDLQEPYAGPHAKLMKPGVKKPD